MVKQAQVLFGEGTMGDIKLFRLNGIVVTEAREHSAAVEKSLQNLIEDHLQLFLGVRFLASEYSTGKTHGGRIDTLGIDENGCPVIIEYKRTINENVINQGLFYLDWLMDHKAEFTLLVLKVFGQEVADAIEWSNPRLLCIAGDFTKYDEYAVQQINRNIELIRHRQYDDDLVLFELVSAWAADSPVLETETMSKSAKGGKYTTVTEYLAKASPDLKDLFESLKTFLMALRDDVQVRPMKNYFAFRRFRNFACVEVHPGAKKIVAYVKVNPDEVILEPEFTRDVRKIGHLGTGDLEITIDSEEDLHKAEPLLLRSYELM